MSEAKGSLSTMQVPAEPVGLLGSIAVPCGSSSVCAPAGCGC